MTIDFTRIAAAALHDATRIAETWAPGGKYEGAEYITLNPRRADHSPGSFRLNTVKGVWRDFATDAGGADLVSWVAYLDGVGQADAARSLATFLSIPDAAGLNGKQHAAPAGAAIKSAPAPAPAPTPPKRPPWMPVLPVPDDAPPPPAAHPKRGKASIRYHYRDAAGRLLFVVARFDAAPPTHPGKDFRQLCWCRGAGGRSTWRWQAPPVPRPLYRLDALAARPDAPVWLTEGEKAAEAVATLAPDAVAMCWPGGAQAVAKVDFSLLAGRDAVLWPDADGPGAGAMKAVSKRLHEAGVKSVRVLRVATLAGLAPDADGALRVEARKLPAGWDAADAMAEGWQVAHLAALVARRDAFESDGKRTPPRKLPRPAPDAPEGRTPANRFVMGDDGLWLTEVTADGNPKRPRFICERFSVGALVRNPADGEWGQVIDLGDPDGNAHRIMIPFKSLHSPCLPHSPRRCCACWASRPAPST